jgi:hypothetical protein
MAWCYLSMGIRLFNCTVGGERGIVVVKELCYSRKVAGSRTDEVNF